MAERFAIEQVEKLFYERGYILLEQEYTNNKTPMKCVCISCGNEVTKTLGVVQKYPNGKCRKCAIETRKTTNLQRYNVENVSQLDSSKKKAKLTKIERYNDPTYNNREQSISTCIQKYGVENPSRLEVVKNKTKNTFYQKYGVSNPMQVSEIVDSIKPFKYKQIQTPSGKMIQVQGYEPQAYSKLLEQYDENEIHHRKRDMPELWYITEDNKQHRYYPDFFIPKDNLIVEVKSKYTYEVNLEVNKLKQQTCLDNGFEYKLMILKGER